MQAGPGWKNSIWGELVGLSLERGLLLGTGGVILLTVFLTVLLLAFLGVDILSIGLFLRF